MENPDLVTLLYRGILYRQPDKAGHDYWASALENGTFDTSDVVLAFLTSNEFQQQVQPIIELYNTLLSRAPDVEGLAYWVNEYRSGLDLDAISDRLRASLEDDAEGDSGLELPDMEMTPYYHKGTSDASAAIAIGDNLMLVADDEDQTLRLYEQGHDGAPLAALNLNQALGLNDTQEADLEAVASHEGLHYWLGSHESDQRSMLFATDVTGNSAENLNIKVVGQFTDLAHQLEEWDANNGHGAGSHALGLAQGVNVEGATFAGDTLYLGLRSPLDQGFAQLIPVHNAPALVTGQSDTANFGAPLRLDLDGRAVRSLEPLKNGQHMILAGPVDDDADSEGFALYVWDGAHAVREIPHADLNILPDTLTAKPEALLDITREGQSVSATVLFDSGTVDWLGNGEDSKDLPADQQQFLSGRIDFTLPDFTPRPGDIAITAVDAPNDSFQFVALKGISEGARITFTDSGWQQDGFRANEGGVVWTAPEGGVPAGTVVTYTSDAAQFSLANSDALGHGGFALSTSGDQVLAFVGDAAQPTFLHAVQTNDDDWQDTSTSARNSALPPGLEEDVSAVALGSVRAAAFAGDGTGTAAELAKAIGDPDNWSFADDALPNDATTVFQLGTEEPTMHHPGERDIGLSITEIWPGQSGSDVTEDWFEITNRSSTTLEFDKAPLYYDDDSSDPEDAVAIQGLSSLAPGQSAIVMVDGDGDSVAEFRKAWSHLEGIDSLVIGYADDASGLGGGGDAVTLWQGNPQVDGARIAMEAYPDTHGSDAASWDVDAQTFTRLSHEKATGSAALGGDDDDVAAVASPGWAAHAADDDDASGDLPAPDITLISTVQGDGKHSPLAGKTVTLDAIVTTVAPGLDGFFLQEEASDSDGRPETSEGIFVYAGNDSAAWLSQLESGDRVRISGEVAEYYDKTQLVAVRDTLEVLKSGAPLPEHQLVTLPLADKQTLEAFEGMRVAIEALDGEPLVVTELYQLGRYGEVTLSAGGRLEQFTQSNAPDTQAYSDWLEAAQARTIILDDANSTQNPDPVIHGRNGQELAADNPLRGGDELQTLRGVMDYNFGEWKVQSVKGQAFTGPARPDTPDADALGSPDITVASFNVLNYFTTLDENGNRTTTLDGTSHSPRGADNAEEFARQEAKIVEAINQSGADVVGLMEIENNGYGENSAIATLVKALNADAAERNLDGVSWAYSVPGDGSGNVVSPGNDAIAVGMIYNQDVVTAAGDAATKTDGAFETANRAPLLQTFKDNNGEVFSVVVNHFKSKGSVVNGEDATGDGQGNNNPTRLEASRELLEWLDTQPTGSNDRDVLIVGDLNAYAMEDPVTALVDAGYQLLDSDYSYVYDGFWGSLNHALASDSLAVQVTGTTTWHINADEASALDYNTDFTNDRQDDNLYADDAFRSSDHDPILLGISLSGGEM